jgi:putative transcriptional regulator
MISSVGDSLKNCLLIATPQLDEGIFKSSVTYICEHNEDGAMGIIINRPSNLMLCDILEDVLDSSATGLEHQPVMVGGPVGTERGFVLHPTLGELSQWESSLQVTDDLALTGSRDILRALCAGDGPTEYLVVLGYAGWDAGQLEQELAENAWIMSPVAPEILFSIPFHKRAQAAATLLGIDLTALSTHGGRA